MIEDIRQQLDRYARWLRDRSALREIGDEYVEITTPYLDRDNDHLQIYVRQDKGGYLLTDDGETIGHLRLSGCELDTPKRLDILQETLNGFGVQQRGDELVARATHENFPVRKHSLVQAMLSVNDLFYLADTFVASLFHEDVEAWMEENAISRVRHITFAGRSGYTHQFDYVLPRTTKYQERLMGVIAHPNKDAVTGLAFRWTDIKEQRKNAQCLAMLNDAERIESTVLDALTTYEIVPLRWSERDQALRLLGN